LWRSSITFTGARLRRSVASLRRRLLSLNQALRAGSELAGDDVKRTARKQSPLKIDEQALLGVSGECGERQAVLNYSNSAKELWPSTTRMGQWPGHDTYSGVSRTR
jgi:hypothetical protein